jgi:two-component system cell cycle sensor histidine kinase/response regulator CckA
LTYSRSGVEKNVCIEIEKLIEKISGIAHRTFPKQFSIVIKEQDIPHKLMIDQSLIETTVLNLLINARDAMPQGGKIIIDISEESMESQMINGLKIEKGDYVRIMVEDQGSGISLDQQRQIFEPFYTTKDRNKGTGLGLAMAYTCMEVHKGSIEVESQLGIGSRFIIYLPIDFI